MAPSSSDILKFVAVRPVRLASEEEGRLGVVRDRRAGDPARLEELAKAARQYASSPEVALRAWAQVDLTPFRPLADARRVLVDACRALDPDVPLPAADLVTAAGLNDVDPDAPVVDALWDALYVAHATGPGAGGRLDIPTAALRTLHLLRLVALGVVTTRAAALHALDARPAISPVLDEVLRPASHAHRTPPRPGEEPVAGASGPG
ncbi:hypothetical protein AB6N24_10400, partial [Cellulomonas sp. 179-A 4D5 NHS]|uniref:hypothetical protein n=1 Tax=Cellulomonas sp. 179-A 4D5 NHS TaxID=3142378 RepID=UPI0039A0F162